MWDIELYLKTLNYAAKYHDTSKEKNEDLLYLVHPIGVCMEIINFCSIKKNFNINYAMQCALLHDLIEATIVTYEDLNKDFNKEIADGVLALSKNMNLPKKERIPDSIERIKKMPYEIWCVKMADRINNLSSIPINKTNEKIEKYQKKSIFIYETLKEADENLANRLLEKIKNYNKYKR